MTEVNVKISLDDIMVKVTKTEGMTDMEILELAKKEAIKQLENKFPRLSYSITDKEQLTFDDINLGKVVTVDGRYGVVTKINSKTINVATISGTSQGHPTCYKDAGDVPLSKVLWARPQWKKDMGWTEGDVGYTAATGEVLPVVVTKKGKKMLLIVIGEKGSGITIEESQLARYMKDTKVEAENALLARKAK